MALGQESGGQEHPGGLDFGHGNANKLAGAQEGCVLKEGEHIFFKDHRF